MKKAVLCAFVLGVFSTASVAVEVNTDHLMFPEDVAEAIALAEEKADMRVADQQDYTEDKEWVGATQKETKTQGQSGAE